MERTQHENLQRIVAGMREKINNLLVSTIDVIDVSEQDELLRRAADMTGSVASLSVYLDQLSVNGDQPPESSKETSNPAPTEEPIEASEPVISPPTEPINSVEPDSLAERAMITFPYSRPQQDQEVDKPEPEPKTFEEGVRDSGQPRKIEELTLEERIARGQALMRFDQTVLDEWNDRIQTQTEEQRQLEIIDDKYLKIDQDEIQIRVPEDGIPSKILQFVNLIFDQALMAGNRGVDKDDSIAIYKPGSTATYNNAINRGIKRYLDAGIFIRIRGRNGRLMYRLAENLLISDSRRGHRPAKSEPAAKPEASQAEADPAPPIEPGEPFTRAWGVDFELLPGTDTPVLVTVDGKPNYGFKELQARILHKLATSKPNKAYSINDIIGFFAGTEFESVSEAAVRDALGTISNKLDYFGKRDKFLYYETIADPSKGIFVLGGREPESEDAPDFLAAGR